MMNSAGLKTAGKLYLRVNYAKIFAALLTKIDFMDRKIALPVR